MARRRGMLRQFAAAESDAAALLLEVMRDAKQPPKLRCDLAVLVLDRLHGRCAVAAAPEVSTPGVVIIDDIPDAPLPQFRAVPEWGETSEA